MKSVFCFSLLFIIFILSLPTAGQSLSQGEVKLTILATSDVHGWLSSSLLKPRSRPKGLIHLKNTIDEIRLKDPELILLDGGDMLQGSPLIFYFNHVSKKKRIENPFFQFVQSLQYDAATVGNHDLEINPVFIDEYVPASNFPWLAANITRQGKPVFKPYVVLKRKGIKVAVLGLTTPGSMMWVGDYRLYGSKIKALPAAAKHWLKIIKDQEKPDIIIGLIHAGADPVKDDENTKRSWLPPANAIQETLRQNKEFDLVFMGHSHVLNPSKTGRKIRYINGIPVIKAGHYAEALTGASLVLIKNKAGYSLKNIQSLVYKTATGRRKSKKYLNHLPQDYVAYIMKPLPFTIKKTTAEKLSLCLNETLALALRSDTVDGSALPRIKIKKPKHFTNRVLRRKDLFTWIPYDNKAIQVLLSKNDLIKLNNPEPVFGRRRIAYNRILFISLQGQPGLTQPKTLFLDQENFKRKFRIIITDYHYNGGGGIFPPLFLDKTRPESSSESFIRDILFDYMTAGKRFPSPHCGMIKIKR